MSNSDNHPIAILGGGLAGLAASMACKAPVFEAADHPGGVGASDEVDGFVFDRGIHVLNTKSPKVLSFLADIGVDMVRVERIASIYSHGVYSAYPFQVNSARLPVALRARCVWDFLRRESNPEPTNYQEWMYRNIGTTFAETFLIPYSEKFWGVSPTEMTFEWTGNKVPHPSTVQVLRGALWSRQTAIGSNAVFHYPRNGHGYGSVARRLALQGGDIHLGHRAVRIDAGAREVTFDNGRRIRFEHLLSTVPLPEVVRMTVDAPESVRAAAGRLRTNSIMVVNLGVGRTPISDHHWVHFPEKDIAFFRLSFPSNFAPGLVPPGTSSVSCEVSYPVGSPPDREALTDRVIQDLVRVGILRTDDEIVQRHTYDIPYAYCVYDQSRKDSVRTIRDWLESTAITPCGRFGLWTYFWSDEAINSGRKAGEKALRRTVGDLAA